MKLKIRLATLLFTFFSLNSVGFAITIPYPHISSNIRESDSVATRNVAKRTTVISRGVDSIGNLFTVEIDKILYVTPEIASDVFRTSDLEQINSRLKRRASNRILAFFEGELGLHSPLYYMRDERMLFFFKISDLPKSYPNSCVSHY